MAREKTRPVQVGNLVIGGGAPIVVQSMTNTDTRAAAATLRQIEALAAAGCELIHVAVPDQEAAAKLKEIVKHSPLPVVADIHFDYRLALAAIEAGVAKIRLNPGNIGGAERVRAVVRAAKANGVALRVGANAGSLHRDYLTRYKGDVVQAMLASVEDQLALVTADGFDQIVVSLKSSDVMETIQINQAFARRWDLPLHLGVTEAGIRWRGTIKSAVGLGILLNQGIGDTIRVSLTGDPRHEVTAAYEILKALHLREHGPVVVACPTCGRCQIGLEKLVEEVEELVQDLPYPLHLAVMGCVVNGPGEAARADLGIAGGKEAGLIFRNGEILRKEKQDRLLTAFAEELVQLIREKYGVNLKLNRASFRLEEEEGGKS
ncbi:MAG: flavodoxin-dependent (E)-4-hydroxy-3-methylbut-2-enyl-diphosphate synthase [Firmicutes bacterium]|nr:flavodoxin-dependent (E)-4-hydroxy-3-methylbut-2-enyl-diphosphate synthase [Bacillota bacterium]